MNKNILLVSIRHIINILSTEANMLLLDSDCLDDCESEIVGATACIDRLICSETISYASFFKKQDNSQFSLFKVRDSIFFVRNCLLGNSDKSTISQIDSCINMISEFLDIFVQKKLGIKNETFLQLGLQG